MIVLLMRFECCGSDFGCSRDDVVDKGAARCLAGVAGSHVEGSWKEQNLIDSALNH